MKRATSILYLLIGLFLFPGTDVSGQNPGPGSGSAHIASGTFTERIFLFTDRSLYAVNENILFKIDCLKDNTIRNRPWSTVIYVELIRQDGHSLVQRIFKLTETGAEGDLLIPGDLPSGIYYLKAYTKWMRNFPPDAYEYKPVRILNPFTDTTESLSIPKDSFRTANVSPIARDTVFGCTTDKGKVKKREKVTLTISAKKGTLYPGEASVSVCKKGANSLLEGYSGSGITFTPPEGYLEYFPEPRGISISGKVTGKNTRQAVPYALVHLAMLNENSFYSGFFSDSRGQFLFTFPFAEGAVDFYLEADKENMPLSLQIDNEFSTQLFSPGIIPFEMTESEKKLAKEICINMQINKMKVRVVKSDSTAENQGNKMINSFYGKPDRIMYTSEYVKLTNILEFFFELVPEFVIEYKNKVPFLKMVKITTLAAYPPLCLIDNIPVTDIGKFLNIPLEKIERIEIVDKAYVAGNIEYNGVIQAFSKNRDMAGIDMSKNSMFFKYMSYSGSKSAGFPDYSETSLSRIPDRRNTLYWNPAIKLKQGEEQKISFYTADMNGEYEILIQGLSADGKKSILGKSYFVVE